MNKNIVIGAIVLLLLVGGGAYMMMNKNSTTTPSPIDTSPTTTSETPSTSMKSLKDLLTSGVAQKCTFSDNTQTGNMDGTTYITTGKMRGDFNSTVSGKTTGTHMIVDGKTSYMWVDGQTTGFKMSFDPQSVDTKAPSEQAIDMNKTLDYNCSPWAVDNSLFTTPTGVKFTDFSTLTVPSVAQTTPGQQNNNCSACNSLSGDAKTQCLTALNCN